MGVRLVNKVIDKGEPYDFVYRVYVGDNCRFDCIPEYQTAFYMAQGVRSGVDFANQFNRNHVYVVKCDAIFGTEIEMLEIKSA